MKITAAVVREKGKPFQFEELDLQDPREGEVMVKIAASGVSTRMRWHSIR